MFRGWELCVLHALSVSRAEDTFTANNSAGWAVETSSLSIKLESVLRDWTALFVVGLTERRLICTACMYT
jgi:hypothetical protein